MTQWPNDEAADEYSNAGKNRIKEIECAHGADANEIKQCPFDSKVGEGFMQALEDPIGALFSSVICLA